jgi:hypothetical protein
LQVQLMHKFVFIRIPSIMTINGALLIIIKLQFRGF